MKKLSSSFSGIQAVAVLGAWVLTFPGSQAAPVPTELAKVNGRSITSTELMASLNNYNEGQKRNLLKDPISKQEILENLIDRELMAQQGSKEKLDQTAEFKAAMQVFRKEFLANAVISRNVASKMDRGTLVKYYSQNKDRFSTDEIRVHHILLKDELQARKVLSELKKAGADFQKLAEKYSIDPTAKNNRGDVGYINRTSPLAIEFKDAAFRAKAGEVVGPVKTAFGYHLIRATEKRIGKPLEFDEVELRVRQEVQRYLVENYVDELKKRAKIQINENALNQL